MRSPPGSSINRPCFPNAAPREPPRAPPPRRSQSRPSHDRSRGHPGPTSPGSQPLAAHGQFRVRRAAPVWHRVDSRCRGRPVRCAHRAAPPTARRRGAAGDHLCHLRHLLHMVLVGSRPDPAHANMAYPRRHSRRAATEPGTCHAPLSGELSLGGARGLVCGAEPLDEVGGVRRRGAWHRRLRVAGLAASAAPVLARRDLRYAAHYRPARASPGSCIPGSMPFRRRCA